jgi:multiple sugar transport system permease protein
MRDGQVSVAASGVRAADARRKPGPAALSEPSLAFILNAPAVCVILLLVAYPILHSFYLSLHRWNLKRPKIFSFIWFGNYAHILSSPEFWDALRVTAIFAFLSVAGILVLGTGMALVLNEEFRGRGLVRSLVLVPWAIPPVVNGLMWQWILNSKAGILNGLLVAVGAIHEYRAWFLDSATAILMLVVAHVWNNVPFAVIVLLAALQTIPAELYDAAQVDRAGAWQRFRHVTLPWLIHPILIIMILQTMTAFRVFDLVYVLTGGGPGDATTVIALLTFRTAFDYLDIGRGNAYAYIIALITLSLAAIYLRALYARGEIKV